MLRHAIRIFLATVAKTNSIHAGDENLEHGIYMEKGMKRMKRFGMETDWVRVETNSNILNIYFFIFLPFPSLEPR